MNKILYKLSCLIIGGLLLTASSCNDVDDPIITDPETPQLVNSTPADGTTGIELDKKNTKGDMTIELTYNQNIFCPSAGHEKITISNNASITSVSGKLLKLTIEVTGLKKGEAYQLTVPEGVVVGPTYKGAPQAVINFAIKGDPEITATLCSANPTPEAVKLYQFLKESYKEKVISGAMANVSWNTEGADAVFTLTGKYPAMNTFDYIHLPFSPSSWIDYSDISPVKDWWNAGGIVSAMWHWNVPVSARLWKGETVMPADWSGNIQLTDETAIQGFARAKVDDIVRVTIKDVAAGAQGSLKGSDWAEIASGFDYFNISGNYYEMTVTEDILAKLKATGLIIGGHDYTVTGVYLIPANSQGDYAFYKNDTYYNASNATKEGTWENEVFTADLVKVATSLKQLQDEHIAVIWRPFHEAAGGWFWWGKDAESCKKMWIAMFDYFKAEGINNLIWVWTNEPDDDEWYPGDEYVDIIGRDLYNKNTEESAAEYEALFDKYGHKIIALTENGSVGLISEQWSAEARWGWFMPWYGAEHASNEWWIDAMSQDYVITRDKLPSLK
jgi:mannan endo-1,4-beta-mannosidase